MPFGCLSDNVRNSYLLCSVSLFEQKPWNIHIFFHERSDENDYLDGRLSSIILYVIMYITTTSSFFCWVTQPVLTSLMFPSPEVHRSRGPPPPAPWGLQGPQRAKGFTPLTQRRAAPSGEVRPSVTWEQFRGAGSGHVSTVWTRSWGPERRSASAELWSVTSRTAPQ